MDIKGIIEEHIYEQVKHNGFVTKYRKPLIGYADAGDPLFVRMPEITHTQHLMPTDLLPEARTVVAFYLPFAKEIIQTNRTQQQVSIEWGVAYSETNVLLYEICKGLTEFLKAKGYKANFVEPTNNFDKTELVSQWSHKHIAYIAGLGKFGYNRQLITPVGCAGRFSSIIINAEIETSRVVENDYLHAMCENCGWCGRNACPVRAIKGTQWNKQLCWEHLQFNEKLLGLNLAQCCGKCSIGPCAVL